MAKISPFCAFHYDSSKIKNLSEVIVPPYDNIPAGEEQKYFKRNPYNFAHVILPQSKTEDYTRAAALLQKWREVGVLREDNIPSYYLYRQYFTAQGKRHQRDTLMCTVQLCEFSDAVVRPHENTYGHFKEDRLQILRKTKSNLSHVFGMVQDREGFLEALYEKFEFERPTLQAQGDDGTNHIVWKIEAAKAPDIGGFFSDKPVYIVDGHHRYSSALMHAKELGVLGNANHPAAHMLFSIANAYDPGLVVLPTHRYYVGKPPATATLEAFDKDFILGELPEESLGQFVSEPAQGAEFALYFDNKLFVCRPRNPALHAKEHGDSIAKLGVFWSDEVLLRRHCGVDDTNRAQKVSYEKDALALWEKRKQHSLLVFHALPTVDSVIEVADEKRFMPQKSTYFFPKLAAGLIMRRLS